MIDKILQYDPAIYHAIVAEEKRQQDTIELIASENIASATCRAAMGTILTNKYAEGYPGKRYYGGCQFVDIVENLAIERATKLFNCKYANVQPHSGTQANLAAYAALLQPGDKILGMSLDAGGHLSHGYKINASGKLYNAMNYGVDENGLIDYEEVRRIAREFQPQVIVAGASAYSRYINFEKFKEIADEVGAYLMCDIAHIAGLVATGLHPSPFPYADVVTTTCHKTLRGPRGGMILWNRDDLTRKINSAVFPGNQGGPLEHVIAAKAIALGEALTPQYRTYMAKVKSNAATLASTLKNAGIDLVSGGTDNHLILIDLRNTDMTGKELEERLDAINITANKNAVPGDSRPPAQTSGLRVGTPTVTTRGMEAHEMEIIGNIIAGVIQRKEVSDDVLREQVKALTEEFPLKDYSLLIQI